MNYLFIRRALLSKRKHTAERPNARLRLCFEILRQNGKFVLLAVQRANEESVSVLLCHSKGDQLHRTQRLVVRAMRTKESPMSWPKRQRQVSDVHSASPYRLLRPLVLPPAPSPLHRSRLCCGIYALIMKSGTKKKKIVDGKEGQAL